jgi:hypothetical protein
VTHPSLVHLHNRSVKQINKVGTRCKNARWHSLVLNCQIATAQWIEPIFSLASMTTTHRPSANSRPIGIDPTSSLCTIDKNRNEFPLDVFYLQIRKTSIIQLNGRRLQHETSEGMAAMKISFKNPRAYRNDIFRPQHVFCLTLIASAARVCAWRL